MKRPVSPRHLPTVPFAIPACWTPDQALAVVELLDGLRELIWARYGLQLLDERRDRLRPYTDNLFNSGSQPSAQKKKTHRAKLISVERPADYADNDDLPF